VFRPPIGALVDELERDPKRNPKKSGRLSAARAASLRFADGIAWRLVYTIDEQNRVVTIAGLGPHDVAYADAIRRL
jgi:mRNA-degrading endonuclease RelE of RelBE toxin-antitoxin system